MAEGWHVAEMILTVQVAEEIRLARLAAQTMASPTVVVNFPKSGNPPCKYPPESERFASAHSR
jgi:hypothetical protein